jgi:hypothetical protein
MNPKSPDRALQQAYSEAEGALARIAHVNRLSRDIMDIKYYEADLEGGTSKVIRISSKKGIVDVDNADSSATELFFYLDNPEIEPDRTKFYIQLTAYTTGNAVPVITGAGYAGTQLLVRIVDVASTSDWSNLYFYYEIVKID